MKHKGKVLELFVEWKKNLEKSTGRKIKVLRSDNRGEYNKSDPFLKLCRDVGIDRHFTVRETSQQNGVAERLNRTLLEKSVVCYLMPDYQRIFGLRLWHMFAISSTGCLRL